MTKTKEILTTPRKSDGTLITQTENQTLIMEIYFNHKSKETFQDKLMRAILSENLA